ncbi:hypothetical protein [Streptomyces sp. NPDC054804]
MPVSPRRSSPIDERPTFAQLLRRHRRRVGRHAGPDPAPGTPVPPILPPRGGCLFPDREKFAAPFAADVPKARAAFMADSQVPWGLDAAGGAITEPA